MQYALLIVLCNFFLVYFDNCEMSFDPEQENLNIWPRKKNDFLHLQYLTKSYRETKNRNLIR